MHLIFLDESAAQTHLTRLYRRAPIGQRCFDFVPGGHFSTYTLLTALRLTGPIKAATVLIDGTVNACVFNQYITQVLARTLRHRDIVVMDNLSAHKGSAVGEAIQAREARLVYLPPYSPDLNPIEKLFSKLKAGLRKCCARNRSV